MNPICLTPAPFSPDLAPSASALTQIFGTDSDDSGPCPESPVTPLASGNPLSSTFDRRDLPPALFGISPSQFRCGHVSLTSKRKCHLRVCMVAQHHVTRARATGTSASKVSNCPNPHCRFVVPCFTHFKPTEVTVRSVVRVRYKEFYALVRSMVLAGTFYVPPPMPSSSKGGSSSLLCISHPFLVLVPFPPLPLRCRSWPSEFACCCFSVAGLYSSDFCFPSAPVSSHREAGASSRP